MLDGNTSERYNTFTFPIIFKKKVWWYYGNIYIQVLYLPDAV